ncbi:thiol reductant ABC exporter subunit CydD [Actinoplanes philippinensis]|uniref:thiol reductant ABC exporter subunit CydD n=1 Tax=Actinoplanes philippinensis TaxID=35752 RepID=UPI0033D0199A
MKPLDPRLLGYARATRAYLAATVVLGAGHAALLIAQAVLLADAITAVFLDEAAITAATVTLPGGLEVPVLAALASAVAARAAVAWMQEVAAARSAAAVKSQLRSRLLTHIADLGPSGGRIAGEDAASDGTGTGGSRMGTGGSGRGVGEIAALVGNGLDALDAYFARYLPQLVLAVLVPGLVLARLWPADLIATATIAVTLPLIPVFMVLVGMHTEAQNRRQFRLLARLSHHFLDVVAGLPTLKLFGRARAQAGIIRRISDEQRRHTMRTLRTAFLSSLVLELLSTLSVALVAVGIGLRLVHGSLDLNTALLVLILAPEAYRPLREVGANYHASAEGLAAAEEVFTILETPPNRTTTPPTDSTARPSRGGALPNAPLRDEGDALRGANGTLQGDGEALRGEGGVLRGEPKALRGAGIVFDGVEVRFAGRAGVALRLNATVRPGEVVALTGPSGCGKSTALAVLLGFVDASAGQVSADGVPLNDLDLAAWRRRIAWVPQRPHLFAASVYDNIALTGNVDGPDVVAAARAAGADGFVRELPEAYATVLGDAGTGLSAGQRQRIALARAFLRDAPIVLLDEPTVNLDAVTAAGVMDAIRRLARGRTVIIAAHRPELIALADREIHLAGERVPA